MPYHSYQELIGLFLNLERSRPGAVSHEVVGRTVRGRDIYLFRVGSPSRPRVLFLGSIHGNEHPGGELLYLYAEWLVGEREPDASRILRGACTLILPVANPDGFESWTRQNANCVDLNRNFPKGWGGVGSSPGTCCGTCRGGSPADQPETQAVIGAARRWRPLWALDVHSGTEVLAYPWSCWTDPPRDRDRFEGVCSRHREVARERGVEPYPTGQVPLARTLGRPVDMAVPVVVPLAPYVIYQCCGTSIDTLYDMGVKAMVLECSHSYNPDYEELAGRYFPRFLAVAIPLSETAMEEGSRGVPLWALAGAAFAASLGFAYAASRRRG